MSTPASVPARALSLVTTQPSNWGKGETALFVAGIFVDHLSVKVSTVVAGATEVEVVVGF